MSTATCHTPDCPNDGLAVDFDPIPPPDWDPPAPPPTAVYCGGCGQEITDVDPPLT